MTGGTATSSPNENMYRVGDHVYFETVASAPYQIRKIEELSQTQNGCVEARVTMYFRRRDLTLNLLQVLDKEQCFLEDEREASYNAENECDEKNPLLITEKESSKSQGPKFTRLTHLPSALQEHVKMCEVFPSSNQEVLQATHIRGKCHVIPLEEEVESRIDFAFKENTFYFTRKFDPEKKTLKPPGNKIRVGSKWQADVPHYSIAVDEYDPMVDPRIYDVPVFLSSQIKSHLVDDFITVATAVGLYARAHDLSSTARDSCLLTTAALAHRSITKEKALYLLHDNDYDMRKALCALVSERRPLLCRDELEDWSPNEAHVFAQAIEKNGKSFAYMKRTLFTGKEACDIVAFYYSWKTTDRFAHSCQKQALNKTDTKLKQVFIPQYSRVNPSVLFRKGDDDSKPCSTCTATTSSNWYAWTNGEEQCKLCRECWYYWKKYGGLRSLEQHTTPVNNVNVNVTSLNSHLSNGNAKETKLVNGRDKDENKLSINEPGETPPPVSFPCIFDGCKLVFRTKSTLERHLQLVHPGFNDAHKTTEVTRSLSQESPAAVVSSGNGHSAHPIRNDNGNNCGNSPFSYYLTPIHCNGRRHLMNKNEFKLLGRRPFHHFDGTHVTNEDMLVKGKEYQSSEASATNLENKHKFSKSLSAQLVCDRLMVSKGLEPQECLTQNSTSQNEEDGLVSGTKLSTTLSSSTTSPPPSAPLKRQFFETSSSLANGTDVPDNISTNGEDNYNSPDQSPSAKRSRLIVDELPSPINNTEIEQY